MSARRPSASVSPRTLPDLPDHYWQRLPYKLPDESCSSRSTSKAPVAITTAIFCLPARCSPVDCGFRPRKFCMMKVVGLALALAVGATDDEKVPAAEVTKIE